MLLAPGMSPTPEEDRALQVAITFPSARHPWHRCVPAVKAVANYLCGITKFLGHRGLLRPGAVVLSRPWPSAYPSMLPAVSRSTGRAPLRRSPTVRAGDRPWREQPILADDAHSPIVRVRGGSV
jgi:hypothetical protein